MFGIHICRGNYRSMFYASGAYNRIAQQARIVPLERLILSPQCGFALTADGNRLSPDDQRLELDILGAAARRVWPRS